VPRLVLDLDAPVDVVAEAAESALGALESEDGAFDCKVPFTVGDPVPVRLTLSTQDGGTRAVLEDVAPPPVPYFSWFVRPILRAAGRRALRHAGAALGAALAGAPAPAPPRRPALAPPTAFEPRQAVLLATVCAITAVATYGGSLLSQNVDYVGQAFGASDRALGGILALSRAGVLIALVFSAFADRKGRRRLMLITLTGLCLSNALSAVAPNLAMFTVGQVLMRGFVNSALTVAAIAVIEEAPDGARAYSLALLGLAGGFGYAAGVILLPLGDLGPETWRVSFVLSAATVALVPGFARHLAETTRYAGLAARGAARGRVAEVFDPVYGSRFGVLVAAAFLFSIFSAPSSQFTNRYLADHRGFSGLDITIFRSITQGLPGVIGIAIGGRLAETKGRRPVAARALFAGTLAEIAFFLYGGPTLWLASSAAIALGGIAAPALGAFNGELFPTEIRGTANALLLVAGVTGSAVGLVVAGSLSDGMGLGPAIALMGIPPLVASAFLIPRLPESAARSLDDVSPSEV
jgi:MFS family permease